MYKKLEQHARLQTLYFSKSSLERMLLLSCAFSIAITGFRILVTGEFFFAWLCWNLFLAFVPFAISSHLQKKAGRERRLAFFVGSLAWLAFIPNSFYILTDLFHLEQRPPVPLWFDLALILSFAWNGLLLGIVSVWQMERLLTTRFRQVPEWVFITGIMFLNAFGVYIGRYLRYNSWDVVSKPFRLLEDMLELLLHPFRNRLDWGMIICYTLLLSLMYATLKRLGRAIR
jgi:uncharacterized membrane protein